jgi:hypothetical protein
MGGQITLGKWLLSCAIELNNPRLIRMLVLAAGLPPAPGRDADHAAVPGEPGSSLDRGRLASPV